ncbi:MAG TPA: hypothetical protein DCL77_08690 [Prolixibacteraceae bacterium]|nr:hypothetical protein [Prolixibacteraceae bacterium]
MNDDKIVVYETFSDPINAHIVKGLLNSYGIECYLSDELMSTLNIAYCAAIGGVKLHVFEKDIDRIQVILKSQNREPELSQSIESKDTEINCPNCHSANVSHGGSLKKKFGIRFALLFSLISVLALIFYPFPLRKTYHCFDCDHEFKKG